MHNGKYTTDSFKQKQAEKNDRRFGPIRDHLKTCELCSNPFVWTGRQHTKAFEQAKFCSKRCANTHNVQQHWGRTATPRSQRYRRICFRHHPKCCAICGFDRVVEVHHFDENHRNNDPRNLVPLCPNHHQMGHMNRWKDHIREKVLDYLQERRK